MAHNSNSKKFQISNGRKASPRALENRYLAWHSLTALSLSLSFSLSLSRTGNISLAVCVRAQVLRVVCVSLSRLVRGAERRIALSHDVWQRADAAL